jgi:hypothetical protein
LEHKFGNCRRASVANEYRCRTHPPRNSVRRVQRPRTNGSCSKRPCTIVDADDESK